LDRQIANLIQAEKDGPLRITLPKSSPQFYELVTMGHCPEGSIRYPQVAEPVAAGRVPCRMRRKKERD
jgi:hypothetical protein